MRGAAAIPLVLAASPLMVLTDPSAMAYAGDPTFLVTGVGTALDHVSGLRLLAALNLLRAAGYALAGVLAIAAVLAPRRRGSVVGAIVAARTAE